MRGLDGLRAVSVAVVVAFHLGWVGGGFLGVDVFFVVSGFLITRLLVGEVERSGSVGLGAFWVRRFRRLVPVLLVVVATVLALGRWWWPRWRLGDLRGDALAALAYVANWRFSWSGESYFGGGLAPSPLRHLWSLAVEEQFYVVWPLVVVAVVAVVARVGGSVRRSVGWVALAGLVASASWMAVSAGSGAGLSRNYYGTDARVFALCAGAWTACVLEAWLAAPPSRAARRARARRVSWGAPLGLAGLALLVVVAREDALVTYRGGSRLRPCCRCSWWRGSWPAGVRRSRCSRRRCWVGSGGAPTGSTCGPGRCRCWWRSASNRRARCWARWSSSARWPWRRCRSRWWRSRCAPVARCGAATARSAFAAPRCSATARRSPQWAWSRSSPRSSPPARPERPGYLRTSDADAVEQALRPAVAPPADAGIAAAVAPTTTTPTRVLSETTLPGPATTVPAPGTTPFDPTRPQLVPQGASADPAALHGRDLRVMVAGDSVGWTLASYAGPDLDAPVRVDNRALIGCGVMPGDAQVVARRTGRQAYPDQCDQTPEADRLGLAGQPDVVLLWVGAWEIYDHELQGTIYRAGTPKAARLVEERIQIRLDRYLAAGVPTVLSLLPCFTDGEAAFDDKRLFLERLDEERVEWVNERVRAVAERNLGWVRLVDPYDALCTPGGGVRELPGEARPVRIDGAHFDEGSAPWVWDSWLAGQLAAALGPAG